VGAACFLLAAWLAQILYLAPLQNRAGTQSKDLDRNGRVDILDAFHLARKLQAGDVIPRDLDVNGDGMVNRKDIEAIAVEAVALENKS